MRYFFDLTPILIWAGAWIAGGWLLAASLFHLRRAETALVGGGIGLVLQTWLANLLAHGIPVPIAFWLSAVFVFLAGLICGTIFRRDLRFDFQPTQWLLLGLLTLLFFGIGRGLGIFDDYQNLPTISLMSAGDIPPHFALNPGLNFGYHYLLLLFAAQLMRLGHMFPWSALDLTRAFVLALPLILAGLWSQRLVRSPVVGFLTGCILALAGGTRWLLLLLPQGLLDHISENITLIGSASTSAPNLAKAMLSNWKIDGGGPIDFPFAFYTGINQPYIMAYTGIAGSAILILLLMLITANRWRHWTASLVMIILTASLAIANEIAFLLLGLGFVIVAGIFIFQKRNLRLPHELLGWFGIFFGATIIAILQGGLLTEIARGWLTPNPSATSYFDSSPTLIWPPSIVSAHLGSLSILNPSQLVSALAEIGPVILLTPLVFAWARKSFRLGRWYEASLIMASLGALIALFIAFKGPLFSATPRLMGGWFFACILYAVPVVWIWARQRAQAVKITLAIGGLIISFSGLVLFGIQLLAIQKPVYATFVTPLDAKMAEDYWNKLDSNALIFDPVVFRAPTLFGRFTKSSPTWYSRSADWHALDNAPDPIKIHTAGFDYIYFDKDYWDRLLPAQQSLFMVDCVKQIAEVDGIHSEQDYTKDFRRLLDIRGCK
jgi:hypothetical protein